MKSTEELIDELSLALLTLSDDANAFEQELVPAIQALAKNLGDAGFASESKQCLSLLSLSSNDRNTQTKEIEKFVTSAAALKSRERPVAESEGIVDASLLAELVEKHRSLLDDLEATLIDLQYKQTHGGVEANELDKIALFVKGYIHNLKGDAGSLSVHCIGEACHLVEDHLENRKVWTCIPALLSFTEIVRGHLSEIAHGHMPESNQSTLMSALNQGGTTSQSVSGNDSSAPDIDMDLLAAVLADPSLNAPTGEKAVEMPVVVTKQEKSVGKRYKVIGEVALFNDFVQECDEHLQSVETTLLELSGTVSQETIDLVFRAIHSIKGASSFYGLLDVTESSHKTETLLAKVRDNLRPFDEGLKNLLLEYIDLQRSLLKSARTAFQQDSELEWSSSTEGYLERLAKYEAGDAPPPSPVSLARDGEAETKASSKESENKKLDVKTFVKVETDRLDQLIDSIGEMCIYSSMLIQNSRSLLPSNEHIAKISHQVEKFSRDLQDIGMSMRLVPIRGLFQKMSRLVWDTSRKIGKDVTLIMEGEDTELDRTIIEKLADPLMHMIRNALDHGIESPEDRKKAGKTAGGTIRLSAYHAGGNIHVRIQDDGKGLNPDKLISKAVEKGILAPGTSMSHKDAFNLIFAAGFSTAAAVTDLSGRGVGMDVVKRNIESMRGRVLIESEVGKGTVFIIELPLTLAVVEGIQVAIGRNHYIVPTLSVVEFMRPDNSRIIHTLNRGPTYEFRGTYLPVYDLSSIFLDGYHEPSSDPIFLVLEHAGEQFIVIVERIVGTISTVIKPLGALFEQKRGIAGGAILGTGDVALIVDTGSLLSLFRERYLFDNRAFESHEQTLNV